jgi:hypothetical protein
LRILSKCLCVASPLTFPRMYEDRVAPTPLSNFAIIRLFLSEIFSLFESFFILHTLWFNHNRWSLYFYHRCHCCVLKNIQSTEQQRCIFIFILIFFIFISCSYHIYWFTHIKVTVILFIFSFYLFIFHALSFYFLVSISIWLSFVLFHTHHLNSFY